MRRALARRTHLKLPQSAGQTRPRARRAWRPEPPFLSSTRALLSNSPPTVTRTPPHITSRSGGRPLYTGRGFSSLGDSVSRSYRLQQAADHHHHLQLLSLIGLCFAASCKSCCSCSRALPMASASGRIIACGHGLLVLLLVLGAAAAAAAGDRPNQEQVRCTFATYSDSSLFYSVIYYGSCWSELKLRRDQWRLMLCLCAGAVESCCSCTVPRDPHQ